jgi:hypothetical protein
MKSVTGIFRISLFFLFLRKTGNKQNSIHVREAYELGTIR